MTKDEIIPCLRFAPSPTGELHIGSLATALIDYMAAKSMGGNVYLRIEDTDQKREVEGAADRMIHNLNKCGIEFDGVPIIQSQRKSVYQKYADELVDKGLAYYDYTESELQSECDGENTSSAVRIKLSGTNTEERIEWEDLVKGKMSLPKINRDAVIIKSNGIPPYNFAHIIDDTSMGTTHVVRGEEWIPSTAEHFQIHEALFGGPPPWQYAHIPVLCIIGEDGNKRKLSKRKDKEALVENFLDEGYPIDALIEYLLTVYNTDFELWRIANPMTSWREFNFRFEKIGSNSPLFDWDKLNSISYDIIANMPKEQINTEVKRYFDGDPGVKITPKQLEDVYELLAVDRGTERPRKDICKYSQILTEFDYVFKKVAMTDQLREYKSLFIDGVVLKDLWYEKIKAWCDEKNIKMRDYTQQIRLALTGREKTTDLFTISRLLLK
ncbi:MAG: hypothetical protein LBG88_02400 [Christensenellaceae bacterium]|jgi:glutamyl-tRNA synthetase|nr:hypothetical protein [Christensenellaceae bacterium]